MDLTFAENDLSFELGIKTFETYQLRMENVDQLF